MEAKQSYYTVLGVNSNSSLNEIRRAYRRLAMQWHPDRWASTPSLLGEANRKFQKFQEAYSVLSDTAKRSVYNAGLYDPTDEYDAVASTTIDNNARNGLEDHPPSSTYNDGRH